MGMPVLTDHEWTPEDIEALPDDGQRHECIDGVHIVTPAPLEPHQAAIGELFAAIRNYTTSAGIGRAYLSPADLRLTPGALVQPDLFVVRVLAGEARPRAWSEFRTIALAVEVLSPSTARHDRGLKRSYYQRAGVEEYWIVDLDARLVERWRPADGRPEVVQGTLTWEPTGGDEALRIDLDALFEEVLGR